MAIALIGGVLSQIAMFLLALLGTIVLPSSYGLAGLLLMPGTLLLNPSSHNGPNEDLYVLAGDAINILIYAAIIYLCLWLGDRFSRESTTTRRLRQQKTRL